MISGMRLLLTLFTILCCSTIAGAAEQESHAGVVFEKACVLEQGTGFSADFNAPRSVDPSSIRFSQSSVGNTVGTPNGTRPLRKLVKDLVGGRVSADDLPPIKVFEKNGQIFTLDNRRLKAFQVAGKPINTVQATAEEIAAEAWKFTTKNGGTSVRVRGGGL